MIKFKIGDRVEVLIDPNGNGNQTAYKKGYIGIIYGFFPHHVKHWACFEEGGDYIKFNYLKKIARTRREKWSH